MSKLRRVIQRRNDLNEQDSDQIERILRSYSERRITEREATHQLQRYVPAEAAGLDLDDLLPMLLALLAGQRGQGNISDLIGRFLGGQPQSPPASGGSGGLGDLIDTFLNRRPANSPQNPAGGSDLPSLIDQLLNDGGERSGSHPANQNDDNDLFDIFDQLLGRDGGSSRGSWSGSDNAPSRTSAPERDHNLRKRR